MASQDPPSPPPTVLRPTSPARGEAQRDTNRPRQTTGFGIALDPRYYGLFGPPHKAGDIGSLGRYRVIELLGEGGMGMVFRAEDVDLGREVALKVMRPEYAADRPLQQRFLREARHTAGLRHENVVTVYQVGEDSGTLFMALELLQGTTLEKRLGVERITLLDALRIGREMACGLAAAHARGLIHRDVKPDNVWIEAPHGRAKVLDFGLARPDRDSQILTHAGTVVGTPGYMAPEQARAETLDERADVFSLGCVIYRMVTGYGPFPCRNFEEMCRAFREAPPAPLRKLNPEAPEALEKLVARMIAFERDDRPESARDVAMELAAIERSLGVDVDLRTSMFPSLAPGPRALPRSEAAQSPSALKRVADRFWNQMGWAFVVATLVGVGVIAALAALLFHPGPGHLRVKTDEHDVVLEFHHDRSPRVWKVRAQNDSVFRAPPGYYSVSVYGRDDLTLRPSTFAIGAGMEQTIVVFDRKTRGPGRDPGPAVRADTDLNPSLPGLDDPFLQVP